MNTLEHFLSTAVAILLISLPVVLYAWLRFGPKRCPNCRGLTWGVPGVPVGIRRWHFHCKGCGTDFQGHWRLPL